MGRLSPADGRVDRRAALVLATGGVAVMLLPGAALAREPLHAVMRRFADGARIQPGRVRLEVPPLVENGNAVGVTVRVDSPMTAADHVRRIALFNDKNPQPDMAVFHLGPRAGRAHVSTRVRLATSQAIAAVAELSDGSFWSAEANVIVTLAACIEEL
ncbi:SoxY-related AACIE arm protein [Phenylobacterium sp. CCH9-H3]|uniref:SoxY-related AACIE arm protein n=2 Tax=unclassified Phenylobacterium TaxID=2640670 RepID=UPI00083AEDC7|nr:SoxY-related AACIE arm protein [Phenylobacterium sp. CCH9-H3]